jgi:hypothetical protein
LPLFEDLSVLKEGDGVYSIYSVLIVGEIKRENEEKGKEIGPKSKEISGRSRKKICEPKAIFW